MIRKVMTFAIFALLAMFGWYFFTDDTVRSNREKARDAIGRVGDTVTDAGVEGLVKARLLTSFGFEIARFLHVTNEEGHIVVYGMVGPAVDITRLERDVASVAGVKSVELALAPQPPQFLSRRGGAVAD